MIFISWGFPFLKVEEKISRNDVFNCKKEKFLWKSRKHNYIPKFCFSKKNIRVEDSFFKIIYLPTTVIYWSSCFDENLILRFLKIIIKWGSLTIFEILAALYALIFFSDQKNIFLLIFMFLHL